MAWRRASFCGGGECVEVGKQDGMVVMRSSQEPRGSVLACTAAEWRAFVSGIKAGEFDDLAGQ